MKWWQIVIQSGLTAGLVGLLGLWFKARIVWENRRREQTSQIAELISLWIVRNYDKKRDKNQILYDTQKKYWELVLWLEAPQLRALNKAFRGGGAGYYKEALILARKKIVGAKDDVKVEELLHWDPIDDGAS